MRNKQPLHTLFDCDPYSCVLRPGLFGYFGKTGLAYYNLRLRHRPADVVEYVTDRMPHLDSFDWWWMPCRSGDETWIEVNIRDTALRRAW